MKNTFRLFLDLSKPFDTLDHSILLRKIIELLLQLTLLFIKYRSWLLLFFNLYKWYLIIDSFEKFRGLILSSNLNWICHHAKFWDMGVIDSLKSTVSLYITLILLHFYYCLFIWDGKTGSVFSLQKKNPCVLTNIRCLAHHYLTYMQLNLLQIDDIYKLKVVEIILQLKT